MDSQSKPWYKPALDWLKLNGGDYITGMIMKYGGDYLKTLVGGFWGKVILLAYKWIALPIIKRVNQHIKNERAAKPKLEHLNEVIQNPNSTNDEIIAAEDDFFNRP